MSNSPYRNEIKSVEMDLGGRKLKLETGLLSQQASGSVTVSLGDTVVICNATMSEQPREGCSFFPMMVDYEEKHYATGKISGSRFVKREGRPSEVAVLNSRLIDRTIRPMFPKGITNDVQIICTVASADMEVHPGPTALIGASAAVAISGMPLEMPVSAVRIGMEDGELILNPSYELMNDGDLDLVVAGSADAITMVECRANEVSDEKMLEALEMAHGYIKEICALQSKLVEMINPEPLPYVMREKNEEAVDLVKGMLTDADLDAAATGVTKKAYKKNLHALEDKVLAHFATQIEAEEVSEGDIKAAVQKLTETQMRKNILEKGVRLDGREATDVRPIFSDVGLLPRAHGSGLFQRGETQVLNVCTLAGPGAAQIMETMDQDTTRTYMHYYNFPAYSVGEVRPMRSAGRREIGHGYLAERALLAVLPPKSEFPYTMRLVSEVLACNGSSSMASVCGSTLSLMDAGVPITAPVAGIAMGLVTNDDESEYKILSDIQGAEDFCGDMDLKVTGTAKGITALQMDIKLKGLEMTLLREAIAQANDGRAFIMEEMLKAISEPRAERSQYAPLIETMTIDPDKIRDVIGKGGETIQGIVAETGAEIDIEQDGVISITAPDQESGAKAKGMITAIVADPEVGMEYDGKVMKVMEFGAFVEFMPGKQGLVHISKWSKERIDNMADVAKEGDSVRVKLTEIDRQGRLNLVRVQES